MSGFTVALLLSLTLFSRWAQGQIWLQGVTYAPSAQPIACGQSVSGSFAGAQDDLHYYFGTDSAQFVGGVYQSQSVERVYRFSLAAEANVLVTQTNANLHRIIISYDSSSGTALTYASWYAYVHLAAGTYYISIEQDTAYGLSLQCSANPIDVFGNVRAYATPAPANSLITGTLDSAQNRFQF